jgi:hypothetical protein
VGVEKKVSELTELATEFVGLGEKAYDMGYDDGWQDGRERFVEDQAAARQTAYDDGFAAGTLAALGMQYRHLTH